MIDFDTDFNAWVGRGYVTHVSEADNCLVVRMKTKTSAPYTDFNSFSINGDLRKAVEKRLSVGTRIAVKTRDTIGKGGRTRKFAVELYFGDTYPARNGRGLPNGEASGETSELPPAERAVQWEEYEEEAASRGPQQ